MGTLFLFLTRNKSRPQFKRNLTYIPGFLSGINFFSQYEYIPEKKSLPRGYYKAVTQEARTSFSPVWGALKYLLIYGNKSRRVEMLVLGFFWFHE